MVILTTIEIIEKMADVAMSAATMMDFCMIGTIMLMTEDTVTIIYMVTLAKENTLNVHYYKCSICSILGYHGQECLYALNFII